VTATATPVLEARNLYAGYGEKSILSDLTLSVGKGEFVTLLGPNGAGKTTTLLTLSGHRGRGVRLRCRRSGATGEQSRSGRSGDHHASRGGSVLPRRSQEADGRDALIGAHAKRTGGWS
jgi:ABC-type glutathione transport system ATPase component